MRKSFYALSALILIVSVTSAQTRIAETLAGESWIACRLVHFLHVVDARSTNAQYKVELDPTNKEIRSVTAQVDVTTFDSGNSNRDSHAMEVIDAIAYPDVMFTSTGVTQNGDSLFLAGRLNFHGIMKDIVISALTRWSIDKLEVKGSFDLSLTAFKIERPSLLMIPVEDKLGFTFNAAFNWK